MFRLLASDFVTFLDVCVRDESFVTLSLLKASYQLHPSVRLPELL